MIDPETIQPGQRVRFDCPKPDCTQHYWHHWIGADASWFKPAHCRMHGGENVVMEITEVVDDSA